MPDATSEAVLSYYLQGAQIAVVPVDDVTVGFTLAGELDVDNSVALERALSTEVGAGRTRIVLDAHEVAFMDSSALGVLLRVHRRCRELGGGLVITGARGSVASLIELTGVDQIMRAPQ